MRLVYTCTRVTLFTTHAKARAKDVCAAATLKKLLDYDARRVRWTVGAVLNWSRRSTDSPVRAVLIKSVFKEEKRKSVHYDLRDGIHHVVGEIKRFSNASKTKRSTHTHNKNVRQTFNMDIIPFYVKFRRNRKIDCISPLRSWNQHNIYDTLIISYRFELDRGGEETRMWIQHNNVYNTANSNA